MRGCLVLLLALLAARPAHAQVPAPAEDELEGEVSDDTELGAVITIESIEIHGNTATDEKLIRRALPIAPGDVLKQSDKRLRDARFKVLALGFFADVQVAMRKGHTRGHVVLDVTVTERGTLVLNKLWFGRTDVAPYWLGVDVGDRNLLGLGIVGGIGVIYAAPGDIDGSRAQWAGELRVSADSLGGSRWGANGSLTLAHGSDIYRSVGTDAQFHDHSFAFRRFGGRWGVTYDVTRLARVSAQLRAESISQDRTPVPAEDLWLQPGESRVVSAGIGFDRDTRTDPILPHSGGRITAALDFSTSAVASDYNFITGFARYEHWYPLRDRRHTIGIRLAGGIVLGDAPRFDRIYASDINPMLTPRAMGLVLSNAEGINVFNTKDDKPAISTIGGLAAIEYAAQLFRGIGKRRVYGGDLFISTGIWGLARSTDAIDYVPPEGVPIDLYIDAGVRIDTDLGIFELTVANALGRLR